MNYKSSRFKVVLFLGVLTALALTVFTVVISERLSDANSISTSAPAQDIDQTAKINEYKSFFEALRQDYAALTSVEMEADAKITIFKDDSSVSGDGRVIYIAKGDKYKYSVSVDDNLYKEGLTRNLDISYNGTKFYMLDHEAKTLSLQNREDIQLPVALPNPFFLPIEFFSKDDDGCRNCRLRFQDLRNPVKWTERQNSITMESTETEGELFHDVVRTNGGTANDVMYTYRIRVGGHTGQRQEIISVSRVSGTGRNLAEIVLGKYQTFAGMNRPIPRSVTVTAYDESGRARLNATFEFKKLELNKAIADSVFAIDFNKADNVWDSDARVFLKQSNN